MKTKVEGLLSMKYCSKSADGEEPQAEPQSGRRGTGPHCGILNLGLFVFAFGVSGGTKKVL
jgi:hypothetical protein